MSWFGSYWEGPWFGGGWWGAGTGEAPPAPVPVLTLPPALPTRTRTRTHLGPLLDIELDPITLDFIDTDDGAWAETPDSRTIVLCQLELCLGESYSTPGDGTRIRRLLETGEPVTEAVVEAEVARALALLVTDGMIADVTTNQTTDTHGRFVLETHWTDLASGSPVDAVFTPFQG